MATFAAAFSAIAVSAAQDVFEIVAPADSRVALIGVHLGQYSDAGDAEAELLSLQFIRGYTVSGNGTAVTPVNLHGHTGAKTPSATVERNGTTVANTGTPETLYATSWNTQVPFEFRASPYLEELIILAPSQRLVVRITAPADAITLNGTLLFAEIGQ